MIPSTEVALDARKADQMVKLMEALEDHDDVQHVWANFDFETEAPASSVIILGLDPGTVATGFGIVAFDNGHLRLESCGVWRPAARLTLPEKLDFLFTRRGRAARDAPRRPRSRSRPSSPRRTWRRPSSSPTRGASCWRRPPARPCRSSSTSRAW